MTGLVMIGLVVVVLLSAGVVSAEETTLDSGDSACTLPQSWHGEWFQTEYKSSSISINNQSLTRGEEDDDTKLGSCFTKIEQHYIFRHAVPGRKNCTRCVDFHLRHANVLQYKETDCAEDESEDRLMHDQENFLKTFCLTLGQKEPHYLFKLKPKPIDCPFRDGPFSFNYSKNGESVCADRSSTVDSCMDDSQLLLKFQACPDSRTESKDKELTCIAEWTESSLHYLVAQVGERRSGKFSPVEGLFRCFVYEDVIDRDFHPRKGESHKIIGYDLGISGSATCTGLDNTNNAEMSLNLFKVPGDKGQSSSCTFPGWFTAKKWHTIDHKTGFRNSTRTTEIYINSSNSEFYAGYWTQHGKVTCYKSKISGEDKVTLVGKSAEDCQVDNICLKMYKRSEKVTQVQIVNQPAQITQDDFVSQCLDNTLPYNNFREFTLIDSESDLRPCPLLGLYTLEDFSSPASSNCYSSNPLLAQPHRVEMGCFGSHMDFFDNCPSSGDSRVRAQCLGGWTNGEEKFTMIAFQNEVKANPPLIYCFHMSNVTAVGAAMSGTPGECPSSIPSDLPENKPMQFLLKYQGSCNSIYKQVDSGGSSLRIATSVLMILCLIAVV